MGRHAAAHASTIVNASSSYPAEDYEFDRTLPAISKNKNH